MMIIIGYFLDLLNHGCLLSIDLTGLTSFLINFLVYFN